LELGLRRKPCIRVESRV